jgi:hypothetical protein
LDAEEPAEGRVAVQLVEGILDVLVAAEDAQQQHPPQDTDGVVVAAVAAGGGQPVEQRLVGQRGQHVADSAQLRHVFDLGPGEQRFGSVDEHGGPRRIKGEKRASQRVSH